MRTYLVDYCNGFKQEIEAESFEEVLHDVDDHAQFTQSNIRVLELNPAYEYPVFIAERLWIGVTDEIEQQVNPINFGELGYYADWSYE